MEPALPGQALSLASSSACAGGRRFAALLLFAGLLAGCGARGPRVEARWRIGLGASALGAEPGERRLAVVCRRSQDVWILDLKDGRALDRIDTQAPPGGLLFGPLKGAYYVGEGLSSVAQVRLADRRVGRRFRTRWTLDPLRLEPGSRRLFCGHRGRPSLGVYRLKDFHLENELAVGGEVRDLDFLDGDAWILTRRADALHQLALKDMSLKAAALTGPEPRALALDASAGLAYVACRGRAGEAAPLALPEAALTAAAAPEGEEAADSALGDPYAGGGIAVVRLADVRRVDFLPLEGGPRALALGPSGKLLAVACEDGRLRLLDLQSRRTRAQLELGGRPGAMLAQPGGRGLLVALAGDKALLKVDPGPGWR